MKLVPFGFGLLDELADLDGRSATPDDERATHLGLEEGGDLLLVVERDLALLFLLGEDNVVKDERPDGLERDRRKDKVTVLDLQQSDVPARSASAHESDSKRKTHFLMLSPFARLVAMLLPGCVMKYALPATCSASMMQSCSWPQIKKSTSSPNALSGTEFFGPCATLFWWTSMMLNQASLSSEGRNMEIRPLLSS